MSKADETRQVRKSSKMPLDSSGEVMLEGDVDCFGNPIPEEETTLENPGGAVVKGGYSAYQFSTVDEKAEEKEEEGSIHS